LCVDRIKDSELEGVDLSTWHYALNGAEPVAPEVLRRFQARFARWGLRPEALNPVYGMSEAALAVTFSDTTAPFRATRFDREALARGRAVEAADGVEIVSVGVAVPRFEIQVRDVDGQPAPEGAVGRVWTQGPSLMTGYLDQPDATARALVDGWLDTGDLGFVYAGELYLTGRAKDVLILRGRNHAPHPVEQACDGVAGVRTGCAAAVSHRPEGAAHEHLMVFVEATAEASDAERAAMPAACADAVVQATGLACEQVIVLDPGTLPRTSSGKIRRAETLRQFLAAELAPPDRVTLLKVAGLFAKSALGHVKARRGG
ncbi:MAG: AMP-binding protein, partial [Myxococcales bacterium]|nr:AMP-binding protein [Myxococcales bacterium]